MEYLELDSDLSYLYGWFAGDGGLYNTTRNRGRLSTEINYDDRDIIYKLASVFDSLNVKAYIGTRTRDTNPFKSIYKSIFLRVNSLEFRKTIMAAGFIEGDKHLTVRPPIIPFVHNSFVRGYIDADGSFGIVKAYNIPFISICVSSENMYKYLKNIMKEVCDFEINLTRNKRDNLYNMQLTRKKAIMFMKWLEYDKGEISLDRKQKKVLELVNLYS